MKNLIVMSLIMGSLSAHAKGWKVNLGVVTIGGGGNPVFSPGSIKTGPGPSGGGGGGGSGGMVPTEPGSPGPQNTTIGKPQIPNFPPIRGGGVIVSQDVVRIVDALGDIATFGEIGRRRDLERAHAEEERAKAVRDGEEKTKAEKRNGLNRALEVAKQNVNDWQDLQTFAPSVLASQERIIVLAQQELASRQQLAANLRAAKNSNQDGSVALRLLTGFYSKQKTSGDADQSINQSLSAWVQGGQKLEEIARNANLEVKELIGHAISSANEETLQNFIREVMDMRMQVKGMLDMSAEKLRSALMRKEGLERELSSLN